MGIYQLGRRLIAASGVVEAHLGTLEGEWVVLSRLALPWSQDASFLERFAPQSTAYAGLGAGVAELIEFGAGGDGVWFAERTGDGEPLRALMTSKASTLTPLEILAIVEQLTAALGRLHDKGLVHGDPSASSVFVGSAGTIGFLHAGFAQVAGRNEKRGPARSEPHAVAPEQLAGGYGPATDVFRLGLMFLEMLTGLSPFVAPEPSQVLVNASSFDRVSERLLQDVPRAIRPPLEWMLQAEPSDRPRASELLDALQIADAGLNESSQPVELARTFQRLMNDRQPPMGARTTELRLSPPRPAAPPPPVPRPSVSSGAVLGRVRAKTGTLPAPPLSPPAPGAEEHGVLLGPQTALVEALLTTFDAPGLDGVALIQLCADVATQLGASQQQIARARFVTAAVVVSNLRAGAQAFAPPTPMRIEATLGAAMVAELGGANAFVFEGHPLPGEAWARAVDVTFALARSCGSTCPAPWQPVVAALAPRYPGEVMIALERILAR